jgi:hypothetical protein
VAIRFRTYGIGRLEKGKKEVRLELKNRQINYRDSSGAILKKGESMKKIITILGVFFLFTIGIQSSWASVAPSYNYIMAVDGKVVDSNGNIIKDPNTTVDISVTDYGNAGGYKVFYSFNEGSTWSQLTFSTGFVRKASITGVEGGTTISFAINTTGLDPNSASSNSLISYEDATVSYSNPIVPSYSQQPVLTSEYFRAVNIKWNFASNSPYKLDVLGTSSSVDGFKSVPIPGSVLLIGSGLFGLGLLRGRRRNNLI